MMSYNIHMPDTNTTYAETMTIARPQYLGGGQWQLSGLTQIVALFGKNGSGKSVLLRSWRDTNQNLFHYVVPERTGDISYQAHYLAQEMSPAQRAQNSAGNYMADYGHRLVTRIQHYTSVRGGYEGSGPIPCPPSQLEGLLASLMPDFRVHLAKENQPLQISRAGIEGRIGSINELSSGENQLLLMGVDILTIAAIWEIQGVEQRVMLIDEPDAHIHPDLQTRFADFLVRAARTFKFQTIVSTHSPALFSALGQFGGTDASVIYVERNQPNLIALPFDEVRSELATCLGGHALMGPMFSVPLLLVEGDDDYRIWSQVPRHHIAKLAVIPCGGDRIDQFQKSLERLFCSIRDPGAEVSGFALIDGDKPKPQPSKDRPQHFIKYIQLQCHEAENLYLTDEVLADLELTWEQALTKIEQASAGFGQKAPLLAAARSWNRQSSDIKAVIEQIAEILDSKKLHWTVRVGKAIGSEYPQGQLFEFLGDEVVNALFPQPVIPETEQSDLLVQ